MAGIRKNVNAWIICRLYDATRPISRLELSKQLCDASFDSMNSYEEFETALKELTDEKLIEFVHKTFTDREKGLSASIMAGLKEEDVQRDYEGYMITERGVFAYRKHLVNPAKTIRPHIGKLSQETLNKYKNVVEVIQKSVNLGKDVALLGIASAPHLLQFIQRAYEELMKYGINILG